MKININSLGSMSFPEKPITKNASFIKTFNHLKSDLGTINAPKSLNAFLPIFVINHFFSDEVFYFSLLEIKDILVEDKKIHEFFSLKEKDIEFLKNIDDYDIEEYLNYFERNTSAKNKVIRFIKKFKNKVVMPKKNEKKIESKKSGLISKFIVATLNGSDKIITSDKLNYLKFADDSDSKKKHSSPNRSPS